MTVHDENELVAGLPLWLWIKTFNGCHNLMGNGVFRAGWPNGRSFLEQECIVVHVFDTISDELMRMSQHGKKRN